MLHTNVEMHSQLPQFNLMKTSTDSMQSACRFHNLRNICNGKKKWKTYFQLMQKAKKNLGYKSQRLRISIFLTKNR